MWYPIVAKDLNLITEHPQCCYVNLPMLKVLIEFQLSLCWFILQLVSGNNVEMQKQQAMWFVFMWIVTWACKNNPRVD